MGTVYVAHDPVLGRMVALKVFLNDLEFEDAAERFTREARSAAALNHANIVTVHDFGEFASQPYIVMEYVQGETIADIIKRKAPVSLSDKLRWMEELCAGAAYAHQVGVIHRDIKPTNLMIDRSGRLKILDFGIAKMLGTLATSATALIGTPGYMAPEQVLGRPIDQRADLFSIAVVCYELLAFTEAFPGEAAVTITHRIVHEEAIPLGQLVPDIHPSLVAVVERGLKKNVEDRFPDAESFRTAIARLRRQLESEPGWEATTMIARGTAPSVDPGRRGTGSARVAAGNVVGVAEMTPPPDPRRTDRETLARRRATQIEAALELSRSLLDKQELEGALDACEQALTLDDTHAVALELELEIKKAMSRQRAVALLADARVEFERGALTQAQSLLQQARTTDPEVPDARRLDRDIRLARVEQERLRQRAETLTRAITAASDALARGEIEASLVFARDALALDPESKEAAAIEADAMTRLDADTSEEPAVVVNVAVDRTMVAPARRTPVPQPTQRPITVVPPAAEPAKDRLAPMRAFGSRLRTRAVRARDAGIAVPKRTKVIVAGVAVAVVAIAAVAAFLMRGDATVPTGTVVIDAVPWATITAVEGEDGTRQGLPANAATPLALNLPAGTYRIRVTGPPPDSEARVVTIAVGANAVAAAPVERFRTITPDEYFEQYLAAPVEQPTPVDPPASEKPPGALP